MATVTAQAFLQWYPRGDDYDYEFDTDETVIATKIGNIVRLCREIRKTYDRLLSVSKTTLYIFEIDLDLTVDSNGEGVVLGSTIKNKVQQKLNERAVSKADYLSLRNPESLSTKLKLTPHLPQAEDSAGVEDPVIRWTVEEPTGRYYRTCNGFTCCVTDLSLRQNGAIVTTGLEGLTGAGQLVINVEFRIDEPMAGGGPVNNPP